MMVKSFEWLILFAESFKDDQSKWAIVACHLCAMLGSLSQSNFKKMVLSSMIVGTNLYMEDCKRYSNLFGKNLMGMRGKTI